MVRSRSSSWNIVESSVSSVDFRQVLISRQRLIQYLMCMYRLALENSIKYFSILFSRIFYILRYLIFWIFQLFLAFRIFVVLHKYFLIVWKGNVPREPRGMFKALHQFPPLNTLGPTVCPPLLATGQFSVSL